MGAGQLPWLPLAACAKLAHAFSWAKAGRLADGSCNCALTEALFDGQQKSLVADQILFLLRETGCRRHPGLESVLS